MPAPQLRARAARAVLASQMRMQAVLDGETVQRRALAITGRRWVPIDYATSSRRAIGSAAGQDIVSEPLRRLIDARRAEVISTLSELTAVAGGLRRVQQLPESPGDPFWANGWFGGLDAAALYGFLRIRAPRTYVEIGSGHSTVFAARAVRDAGLATRIVSIDPQPRADISALCHEAVRTPLELADLERFDALEAGDMVLMDGSHRVFTGSDAVVFFLRLLPRLAPGVLVGVDDVHLPLDYPSYLADRYWSEQYLLAAWLLAGDRLETVLPGAWVVHDRAYAPAVDALWRAAGMEVVPREATAFWFLTR